MDVFSVRTRMPERDLIGASPWLRRWYWHLDHVPSLLGAIREDLVPTRAARVEVGKVQSSKVDAPAPVNVSALDDADELWGLLVPFVVECAELLAVRPPQAVGGVWSHHGQPAGLPAQTTPDEAYRAGWDVVAFLTRWAPDLEFRVPHGVENVLFDAVRRLAARWTPDGSPTRQRARVCSLCGERRVLVGEVDGVLVAACTGCGAAYENEGEQA